MSTSSAKKGMSVALRGVWAALVIEPAGVLFLRGLACGSGVCNFLSLMVQQRRLPHAGWQSF